MSHVNDQNQPQGAYQSKDTVPGLHPDPPPATTHEDSSQKVAPGGETEFKGHGFWRGCCAGLCCYCCLDMCF